MFSHGVKWCHKNVSRPAFRRDIQVLISDVFNKRFPICVAVQCCFGLQQVDLVSISCGEREALNFDQTRICGIKLIKTLMFNHMHLKHTEYQAQRDTLITSPAGSISTHAAVKISLADPRIKMVAGHLFPLWWLEEEDFNVLGFVQATGE